MRSTTTVRISDLGTVITGGTPPTKKREFYGQKVPLIKPTDMNLGQRYIGDTEESLSDIGINKFKKKLVPANTPCVVTIGTIGKSCLTKELSLVNQAVNCIVVDREKYDYMYIYYLMQLTIPKVRALNSGTASGRENVSKSAFESIEVDVLPLKEQMIVSGMLSSYDSLIENNNRRVAILEEMAQSIYREWFVKFRFPGHEQCQMVESPLGLIPEGWVVNSLSNFGTVITGKTPSKKRPEFFGNDIPFIKTPDMHSGMFVTHTSEGLSREGGDSQEKKYLPPNSLSVSCIGTAGVVAINATEAQTNQQINSIVLNSPNLREFLYFALLDLKPTIERHGATGATMTNLSKGKFEALLVATPPESLLERYSTIIKASFDQILNLTKKNQNLKAQRDLVLPKLISGQIDLSQAEQAST